MRRVAFTHCILSGGSGGTCFYSALCIPMVLALLERNAVASQMRLHLAFEKEASALQGLLLLLHKEGKNVSTTCKLEVALNRA